MAQLVKRLTLDFGSGRDLGVREFEPRVRLCTRGVKPAWDLLSLPLCVQSLSFSLSQNKYT